MHRAFILSRKSKISLGIMVLALWALAVFTGCSGSLDEITINEPLQPIMQGASIQLVALGSYSDGNQREITDRATWASDNPQVLTVSDQPGSKGRITGVSGGTATLSCSMDGKTATLIISVQGSQLTAIEISPLEGQIIKGKRVQLRATGVYSDGTKQNITTQVLWESDDPAVLDISNVNGSQGLATAVDSGDVTVTAVLDDQIGVLTIQVGEPTLLSIMVTPQTMTLGLGLRQQFLATGVYSDGTTQDLTHEVSWSSSDSDMVDVSNDTGTEGMVTAAGRGSVTITATLETQVGAATVTVK